MARDRSPITKQSRREGVALHPKANKVMVKKRGGPGMHGQRHRGKPSQYSLQLREKQKVKRMYGLLERQFRRIVAQADKNEGVTGEIILELLERRLDNVVYRLHLAQSRRAARQLVSHGHLKLNGKRVDVPSMLVSPGDEITIREKSSKNTYFTSVKDELKDTNLPSYSWLSFNPKTLTAKVTGSPQREEMEPGINEQLIVEFYSR
ncbi:MAG: 30S ribosomal protein S4 [Candidatus Saccharimonadales bacterium]